MMPDVHPGQVCLKVDPTFQKPVDTCQGDSGGPVAFQVDECEKILWTADQVRECIKKRETRQSVPRQYQLEGLVSWGMQCGSDYPSFNTRVSFYMPWIIRNTRFGRSTGRPNEKPGNRGRSFLQYADVV